MNFGEWQLISSSDCTVLISSDLFIWRTRLTTYFVTKAENIYHSGTGLPVSNRPATRAPILLYVHMYITINYAGMSIPTVTRAL